jgi:hypothetical protein
MSSRLDPSLRQRLVRGALADLPGDAAARAVASRLNGNSGDPLPMTLYLDAQLSLVDDMLHYFDRASMAHSLEVRVPFCDPEVAAFCATIPPHLKVKRLETKHILKVAAGGHVPDRIIHKRKIGFFANSLDAWFRAQTDGALAEWLLGSGRRYADFLDTAAVEELTRRHLDGTDTRYLKLLLSVLMLVMGLAPILAPLIGGQLLVSFGWRSVFWLLAVYGAFWLTIVTFFLAESLPPARRRRQRVVDVLGTYLGLLRDRRYLGYAVTRALIFAGLMAYISGSPFVFIEDQAERCRNIMVIKQNKFTDHSFILLSLLEKLLFISIQSNNFNSII